jgi:hypothetical protein
MAKTLLKKFSSGNPARAANAKPAPEPKPPRRAAARKIGPETAPQPEVDPAKREKMERERLLTDACMANPRWSHVIHYHNKIKKYGVHLDLVLIL